MSDEGRKVIYSMIRVSKFHNKKPVLKDISLSYFYGAKIGVLGLNGSGKSSLLRILAGVDQEFQGQTILSPGHTVGFLEQEPQLATGRTVRQIVEEGVQETVDLLEEFNRINLQFAEPMSDDEMNDLIARQGEVQEKLDHLEAWDLDSRLEQAMDALRCPPGDTPVDVLSGGERRRVALCRLLLQKPDILLLDEPTNHLDLTTREALAMALNEFEGTVMLVSHDRALLRAVCDDFWLVGHGTIAPFDGDLDDYQRYLLDMARQKRESLAEAAGAAKQAAAPTDKPALSGAEQRKLQAAQRQQYLEQRRPLAKRQQQLEQQMDKLNVEKASLEARLCEPLDPGAIAEAGRKLKQCTDALEEAEMNWLEVSAELEAVETAYEAGTA